MADIENVVLIGNGFDLNLGLDTSFKSFFEKYKSYFGMNYNSPENLFMKYVDTLNKDKNFINDWYNIEKLLGDFCINNHRHDFRIEYQNLKINLEKFLNEQLNNFNISNKDNFASNLFIYFPTESLLKTKIINFNYTNTAETLAKNIVHKIPEVTYMHGKLNDQENPIIFGINDKIIVNKNYSYIRKGSQINHKIVKNIDALKNAKNIFFFGHSLGETDHSYFEGFFQFLLDKSYPKFIKNIVFFIHDKSIRNDLSYEINKLTNYNITTLITQFNLEFIEVTNDQNSFRNASDKIRSVILGNN